MYWISVSQQRLESPVDMIDNYEMYISYVVHVSGFGLVLLFTLQQERPESPGAMIDNYEIRYISHVLHILYWISVNLTPIETRITCEYD